MFMVKMMVLVCLSANPTECQPYTYRHGVVAPDEVGPTMAKCWEDRADAWGDIYTTLMKDGTRPQGSVNIYPYCTVEPEKKSPA